MPRKDLAEIKDLLAYLKTIENGRDDLATEALGRQGIDGVVRFAVADEDEVHYAFLWSEAVSIFSIGFSE